MTYCLELSRTKVALELDFAVTVTFEGNGFVTTLCYHVESGVNFGTVGERVKNVDCTGCKSVELSCDIGFNDNELLDLGFNAFEVTSIVGVDFKNCFKSTGIYGFHYVRTSGYCISIHPTCSIDFSSNEFAAFEFSTGFAFYYGKRSRSIHRDVERSKGSVAEFIEIRNIIRSDGDGVSVLVDEMNTGEFNSFTFLILGCAYYHISSKFCTCFSCSRRITDKSVCYIVSCSDGLAIAEYETFIDFYSEGFGSVFVENGFNAAADGGVNNEFAALVVGDRRIVIDKVTDHLIGCVVGPPCSRADIAGEFSSGTIDKSVGSGFNGLVNNGFVGRIFNRLIGVAASCKREHHNCGKKKCEKFLHLNFLLLFFMSYKNRYYFIVYNIPNIIYGDRLNVNKKVEFFYNICIENSKIIHFFKNNTHVKLFNFTQIAV